MAVIRMMGGHGYGSKLGLFYWFEDLDSGDVPLVGDKNASLGEMTNVLREEGRVCVGEGCHDGAGLS
jgi:hypothetical protein